MAGMKLYEIRNGMIDTLDIFLESEQTEMDRENYNDIMDYWITVNKVDKK